MQFKKDQYAFVQRYYEDAASPTGYTMRLAFVTDDAPRTVPVSQAYWDLLHSEEYVFPLVQENMIIPEFDENGILLHGKKPEPGDGYNGAFRWGCPKGFGYILQLRDGKLVLDGKRVNELKDAGLLAFYNHYNYGTFEELPREDVVLEMADDIGIYCLDFYGGDRYQKRRSLWYLHDVLKNNKNCYWLNLFDVWNGEGKIDHIVMFRHPPKGPDATGGNLSHITLTNAQRLESATGSDYADESWYEE